MYLKMRIVLNFIVLIPMKRNLIKLRIFTLSTLKSANIMSQLKMRKWLKIKIINQIKT